MHVGAQVSGFRVCDYGPSQLHFGGPSSGSHSRERAWQAGRDIPREAAENFISRKKGNCPGENPGAATGEATERIRRDAKEKRSRWRREGAAKRTGGPTLVENRKLRGRAG